MAVSSASLEALQPHASTDGAIRISSKWAKTIELALENTLVPETLMEALRPLKRVGVDVMHVTEELDIQAAKWRRNGHLKRIGLPHTYPVYYALAIYAYTLQSPCLFAAINRHLFNPARREGASQEGRQGLCDCMPYIKLLDTALGALPLNFVYVGQVFQGVAWSCPSPSDHDIERLHMPGRNLLSYRLKSTSAERKVVPLPYVYGVEASPTTLYIIDAKKCYTIAAFCHVGQDGEARPDILFRPLSMFKANDSHRGIVDQYETVLIEGNGLPRLVFFEQILEETSETLSAALTEQQRTSDETFRASTSGGISPRVDRARKCANTAMNIIASAFRKSVLSDDDVKNAVPGNGRGLGSFVELVRSSTRSPKPKPAMRFWSLSVSTDDEIPFSADARVARARCSVPLASMSATDEQDHHDDASLPDARTVRHLVRLVRTGTSTEQETAATAIDEIASDERNDTTLTAANAIKALTELAQRGSSADARQSAAGALCNLSANSHNDGLFIAAGSIQVLIDLLVSGTCQAKEDAALALRNLANRNENQVAIADAGGIEPLVELMRTGSSKARERAAGAIWNLAVDDDNKRRIAAAHAIEPLIELTRSGTPAAKEKAAGALWNLGVNEDNQVTIAKAGAIGPLVDLVRSGDVLTQETAAVALWCLAANNDNQVAIAAAGGIGALVELVCGGSDGAKEKAAGALQNLALNDGNKAAIAEAGGILPLVELVRCGTLAAREKAATTLWLLACNDENRAAIAATGYVGV